MNPWTAMSIEFANQRNYLDELFRVYPCIPEGLRDIDRGQWKLIEQAFHRKDKLALLRCLLELDLFPIKDSYVAYLRRDPSALGRNPNTVDRLCGRLFELGLDEILDRCSQPKEMNRQIGPLFKRWVHSGALGAPMLEEERFLQSEGNAILDGSDAQITEFATKHLHYDGTKRLDFVARFNNKFVVGEAKFLTDFGGHQNAQFEDALALLRNRSVRAVKVAVLDGVLYIPGNHKMFTFLSKHQDEFNIMSALVLREFLYQL